MRLVKLIFQSFFFGILGGLAAMFVIELISPVMITPKVGEEVEEQLTKLDEMQISLKELQGFISGKKERLKKESATLATLKEEREKLEPVLDADRKTVESILELYQEKYRWRIWKERAFGFAIGFLSSLLASFIII